MVRCFERQAELGFVADMRIELVTKARRVAPGEKPGTRWAAIGRGDVAVPAADAACGEGIDIRRPQILAAMNPDVAKAEIVGDNDQDIGFVGTLRG